MKDYLKRKTFTQNPGWTGPWRNIDIGDIGHTKLRNKEKKKYRRRARRVLKIEREY